MFVNHPATIFHLPTDLFGRWLLCLRGLSESNSTAQRAKVKVTIYSCSLPVYWADSGKKTKNSIAMYLVTGRRFPKESLLFKNRVFYETSPRRLNRDNLKSVNRVSVSAQCSIYVNFHQISLLCAVLRFTRLPPLGSILSPSYKNASTTQSPK
jgi:hypothetical protein